MKLQEDLQGLSPEDREFARQILAGSPPNPNSQPPTPNAPQPSTFIKKLRLFSGRKPLPAGEVDFESWGMLAKQLVEDAEVTEATKQRVVLSSLLRPALDIVLSENTAKAMLATLKTVYGNVTDGKELFVQFWTIYQEKESASEYLQRLYLKLLDIVDKDGLKEEDVGKTLLEQFVRGCREEHLLDKLQLERRLTEGTACNFPELLLEIRKEEQKHGDKEARLKLHKASVHQVSSSNLEEKVEELGKKLESVAQVQSCFAQKKTNDNQESKDQTSRSQRYKKPQAGGYSEKTFFCFNCGYDGHKCRTCRKSPNPQLVQRKLLERSKAGQHQEKARVQSN